MELFDRIACRFELKKQKREFDELFPDILFAKYFILYEAQKENEKPDGELVSAARNYALTFENGINTIFYKLLKENIQKQYGFSSKPNKYNEYGAIKTNETALEKMKKYIYSNVPVLTCDEKYELVSKVFDLYTIGMDDAFESDDKSEDKMDSLFNHLFENAKSDLSHEQEKNESLL